MLRNDIMSCQVMLVRYNMPCVPMNRDLKACFYASAFVIGTDSFGQVILESHPQIRPCMWNRISGTSIIV